MRVFAEKEALEKANFSKQGDAGIAQLVERNLAKVEVASSSLVSRSINEWEAPKASHFVWDDVWFA